MYPRLGKVKKNLQRADAERITRLGILVRVKPGQGLMTFWSPVESIYGKAIDQLCQMSSAGRE